MGIALVVVNVWLQRRKLLLLLILAAMERKVLLRVVVTGLLTRLRITIAMVAFTQVQNQFYLCLYPEMVQHTAQYVQIIIAM